MGLFRRNRPQENRTVTLGALKEIMDRHNRTYAGVSVDEDGALASSSVWAAQELIAGVGSSLPLDEFKRDGDRLMPVPLSPLFSDPDPDPSVSAVGLRAQLLRSVVARGNAYAFLLDASRGVAHGMVAVNPNRVSWRYERVNGVSEWQTYVDNAPRARWPYGDLWHFPLFQQPGSPIGLNPIDYHRQTVGAALAAQKFGAQYFDAGGHPTLVVKMPDDPGFEESKKIKTRVTEATRGNRDPMIVPGGWTVEPLSITPDEAQFIETQRWGVEEVARAYLGGFPELIGGSVSSNSVTYANREQRLADFIALSLAPRYLIPFEAALSALLPPGRIVKHNVNALLRSDLAGRYASYEVAAKVADLMGTPMLTVDEMRALEDLPAIGGTFTRKPQRGTTEPRQSPQETHVHLGDTNVAASPAPQVTVRNDIPTAEAPVVNITNDVRTPEAPPPVVNVTNDVKVPEPKVTVVQRAEPKQTVTRKVKRDNDGRITELTDEVS